jgi:hypothetical protein
MLARLGLPPMPPEQVEEAVEEVRRRGVRLSRTLDSPGGARRGADGGDVEEDGAGTGQALRRSPLDLVVVVDDGLYVGHRLALRDVSDKLAVHVPLLVLATNERLWHTTGRPR